jgi:hypothetical protein
VTIALAGLAALEGLADRPVEELLLSLGETMRMRTMRLAIWSTSPTDTACITATSPASS